MHAAVTWPPPIRSAPPVTASPRPTFQPVVVALVSLAGIDVPAGPEPVASNAPAATGTHEDEIRRPIERGLIGPEVVVSVLRLVLGPVLGEVSVPVDELEPDIVASHHRLGIRLGRPAVSRLGQPLLDPPLCESRELCDLTGRPPIAHQVQPEVLSAFADGWARHGLTVNFACPGQGVKARVEFGWGTGG